MGENIEDPTSKLLRAISKSRKIPFKVLQEEYTATIEQVKAGGFTGNVELIAKNAILSKYRKLPKIKRRSKYALGTFLGFKIGDIGMADDAQRMRDWAKFCVENRDRGQDWAIEHQLVREQGDTLVVLDTRQKVFGRPNKNYLEPLPPATKLRRRNIILLAKESTGETLEYSRLQTNDNKLALAWGQLPFHVPVTFPASIQTHDNAGYMLSSSSAEASKTVFRQVKEDWDIYNLFVDTLGEDVTPLNEFEKYHEATKDAWDRWVLLKGVVSNINFDSENWRGIPGTLIDPEMGYEAEYSVRFYVPQHLKVNFGQYSEIYLLGKSREIRRTDETSQKRVKVAVVVDAWGFMPIPGRTTTPQESLLEDDEEEVEGFIGLE